MLDVNEFNVRDFLLLIGIWKADYINHKALLCKYIGFGDVFKENSGV